MHGIKSRLIFTRGSSMIMYAKDRRVDASRRTIPRIAGYSDRTRRSAMLLRLRFQMHPFVCFIKSLAMNIRFVDLKALKRPLPAIFLLLASAATNPVSAADQWTNLHGTSTVTAEMLGMWNGRILLLLENGRRVSVKKDDLEARSRIQADARFEELQQRLSERREEIKSIAEEASSPAPRNMPPGSASAGSAIPNSPRYEPVPEGSDLRETLVGIRDQLLAGHVRVLYDTLPASHQKAVDDLFNAMLAKVDAQAVDAQRQTLHGIGEVIVSRQRWLFSHPRLALMNDSQQAEMLASAEFLRAMFSEDVMSIEAMRGRSFGETLAKVDEIIAPYLFASINDPTTGISSMQPNFEVAPGADGKMIAKVVLPLIGPIYTQAFVNAEGRWAWGESATTLTESLQEATRSLEQAPDNSANIPELAKAELAKFDQAVSALMNAQTRQEFHRTLDEILPVIAQLVNDWSGYQPPAMQGLAGPFGGAGGSGAEAGYAGEPGYGGEAGYEAMMSSGSSDMSGANPAGMGLPTPGANPAGMGLPMPGAPGAAAPAGLAPSGSGGMSGAPGLTSPPALQLPL